MSRDQQLLFITTSNLATNPRLLKELKLASENGFATTVILFKIGNWSDEQDILLQSSFKSTRFIQLSALRHPFFPWFLSSLLEKVFRKIPLRFLNDKMLAIASGKRAWLILRCINRLDISFDWIIAHNPATFYPALVAAEKNRARLGIDIEDYHPGETNDSKLKSILLELMSRVLPKADYCSYAAPMILSETILHISLPSTKQLTILNGFEGTEFTPPIVNDKAALQLVWFSQNIDVNRGLENIISVANKLYPLVELHLIGNLKPGFEQLCLKNKTGIILHKPLPQKELHAFLSMFDIGLAIDIPVDRNRELALTNKIIAYAQAGLFIAATHTPAQDQFLINSELFFLQFGQSVTEVEAAFRTLGIKKQEIRESKKMAFKQGRVYDWEQLSIPLLNKWKEHSTGGLTV